MLRSILGIAGDVARIAVAPVKIAADLTRVEPVADEFTRQAVATSLRTMFEGSYFSICKVDAALKALKIVPIKAQYEALNVLHCVHFSTMTTAFREELILRTMALFADGSTFDLSVIERGFLGQHAPDLGRVVSIQPSPGAKRGFIGLGSKGSA